METEMNLARYYTEPQVKKLLNLTTYKAGKLRRSVAHFVYGRKYWYLREGVEIKKDPDSGEEVRRIGVLDYVRENAARLGIDMDEFEKKREEIESQETYEDVNTDDWVPVHEALQHFPFSRQRLSQISSGDNGNDPEINRIMVNRFWVYSKPVLKQWMLTPDRLEKIRADEDYKNTEYGPGYDTFAEWKEAVEEW